MRDETFGAECEHGHLARKCQQCDDAEEIAALRARVDELEQRICYLKDEIGKHRDSWQAADDWAKKLEAALREIAVGDASSTALSAIARAALATPSDGKENP